MTNVVTNPFNVAMVTSTYRVYYSAVEATVCSDCSYPRYYHMCKIVVYQNSDHVM